VASQQDIKRRISSVRNTRKITKALELVSASKLRRAQLRIEALRPYADRMRDLMIEAASRAHVQGEPLLDRRDPKRVGVIVLTGDRGLAGAFNGQVVRRALQVGSEHAGQGREVVYLPAGRKGLGTLRFRGRDVLTSWTGFSDRPEYRDAAAIAETISKAYVAAELDVVVLVYNRFVSALQQQVEAIELLPIPEGDLAGMDARERSQEGAMLFEPDVEEMIGELLVSSLEVTVYRALLESTASEHGARMTAMRNASENAADLISAYTLAMNRARQAEITQEILEVVAGADALQ
jgi:F-type H+-transporting ATPase subunit gamma